jgi:predicted ATPase
VLAELFVEASKKRHVQFIVETHSEHLFRRLQTVIARGDASAEACALYFVDRDGTDAHVRRLELDDFGRLQEWPEHFFGDALGETRELARLAFERQRQTRDEQPE